jgi:hypothetical protein
MPVPAGDALALGYGGVQIFGSPGTTPTPAPAPQRDWLPTLTKTGGKDSAQSSMVAPDVMLFSEYHTTAVNQGPSADQGIGMTRRRANELPMPAVDPTRIPVVGMYVPRLGGRSQINWPRAFQRFPSINSGGGNG